MAWSDDDDSSDCLGATLNATVFNTHEYSLDNHTKKNTFPDFDEKYAEQDSAVFEGAIWDDEDSSEEFLGCSTIDSTHAHSLDNHIKNNPFAEKTDELPVNSNINANDPPPVNSNINANIIDPADLLFPTIRSKDISPLNIQPKGTEQEVLDDLTFYLNAKRGVDYNMISQQCFEVDVNTSGRTGARFFTNLRVVEESLAKGEELQVVILFRRLKGKSEDDMFLMSSFIYQMGTYFESEDKRENFEAEYFDFLKDNDFVPHMNLSENRDWLLNSLEAINEAFGVNEDYGDYESVLTDLAYQTQTKENAKYLMSEFKSEILGFINNIYKNHEEHNIFILSKVTRILRNLLRVDETMYIPFEWMDTLWKISEQYCPKLVSMDMENDREVMFIRNKGGSSELLEEIDAFFMHLKKLDDENLMNSLEKIIDFQFFRTIPAYTLTKYRQDKHLKRENKRYEFFGSEDLINKLTKIVARRLKIVTVRQAKLHTL